MKSLSLLGLAVLVTAASADARQTIGPAQGALVIVGGAMQDHAIVGEFIALAGGPDAPIVIVPTAGEGDDFHASWAGLRIFRTAGARNLQVLHTRDRAVADSEAFIAPLRQARGVFFTGGRQWRLADAYLGTQTERAVRRVLERGGVVGGSSAGATILGSFLVRGDTKGNELMIGDHVEGFGLLKDTAIDQHLLRRNRQFDLVDVIAKHPHLLGLGIDENTAIVVRGDRFEVLGQGYVAVYDARHPTRPPDRFFLLAPGDRYDLATREATRPAEQQRPLENVGPTRRPPGRF